MTNQKEMRIGMDVRMAKKMVVFKPPPTFHAPYAGTRNNSDKRTMFEKESLPGPSAGRGAFWIAGDYTLKLGQNPGKIRVGESLEKRCPHRSGLHTTVEPLIGRGKSFWSIDELELAFIHRV